MNQNEQLDRISKKMRWDVKKHRDRYLHGNRADEIMSMYQKRTGQRFAIDAPVSYNEKLQWLKCFWRDALAIRCADKLQLRSYLEGCGLREYSMPIIGSWIRSEDIPFQDLPQRYVLKANHSSGMNVFVDDALSFDHEKARRVYHQVLQCCPFHLNFEWVYEAMTPTIIAEPILPHDGHVLFDYKFYCFRGKARFVHILNAVDPNDPSTEPEALFLDHDFNPVDGWFGYRPMSVMPRLSVYLEDMKRIAERVSAPFPHVRVDLVATDHAFYIGEMTFFPGSGCDEFSDDALAVEMGKYIKIDEIKDAMQEKGNDHEQTNK